MPIKFSHPARRALFGGRLSMGTTMAASAATLLLLGTAACTTGTAGLPTEKNLSAPQQSAPPASEGASSSSDAPEGVPMTEEQLEAQPDPVKLQQTKELPRLEMAIYTGLALDRYAYTTASGNIGCEGKSDRPPFTMEDDDTGFFCLVPGPDSDDWEGFGTRIDVTYKIHGDAAGRTLWIYASVPRFGINEVYCDIRKADMVTHDSTSPYYCEADWIIDRGLGMNPKPTVNIQRR